MTQPGADQLREVLRAVEAPGGGAGRGDLVSAGLVEDVQVRAGLVQVTLRAERAQLAAMEGIARRVEALLASQPGITNASVVLTSHRPAGETPAGTGSRGAAPQGAVPRGAPPPAAAPARRTGPLLPEVRVILAVASGKGGVGKSTVAVNLAVALARQGLRVGLLDADVHGPSLPRMLGVGRKPEVEGEQMIPIEAWGLKAMSIGFLVAEETAMIWRGPMVMGALDQMMGQVRWGALDILVVDMPPGTGDAQLTLAQRVSLAGAVIVSTPQDIALLDARRGIAMFEKTRVPVLGIVENMSQFACPHCGGVSHVFGHGGARIEAQRQGVEFLGELPLLLDIREGADRGTPVAASDPEGVAGRAFAALASRVWEKVGGPSGAQPGPRIVVD